MARRLTYDEFLRWLDRNIRASGNTRSTFAADRGISPAYLSDILNRRRLPSQKFLAKLQAREIRLVEIDAA